MKLKKTTGYTKSYNTQEEMFEALKDDPRIEKISYFTNYFYENTPTGQVIKEYPIIRVDCNPIMPYNVDYNVKPFLLGPIGKVSIFIRIKDVINNMEFKIENTQNPDKTFAPHVMTTSYSSATLCWGNIGDDIYHVISNRDYYWLIKFILDVIQDWTDARGDYAITDLVYKICAAQIEYNPSLKEKLYQVIRDEYKKKGDLYIRYEIEKRENSQSIVHYFLKKVIGDLV